MELIIDEKIREKYPDLRIAVVAAENVNNVDYSPDFKSFITGIFREFACKFDSQSDFENHKNIRAWRDIYRSFGINPKKKKPTAESFLIRIIRNNHISCINPAVDAYLCAETAYYLPIGGYDLTKITGNITLKLADGTEHFLGVGADTEETVIDSEVVYADESRILTRCWNYRDCDFSKINTETKKLAFFSEAPLLVISDDEVKNTINQVAENLKRFCEAECKVLFLSASQNELVLL